MLSMKEKDGGNLQNFMVRINLQLLYMELILLLFPMLLQVSFFDLRKLFAFDQTKKFKYLVEAIKMIKG